MADGWGSKHDPENLIDYGQPVHNTTSIYSLHEDSATDRYSDPYAGHNQRDSYLAYDKDKPHPSVPIESYPSTSAPGDEARLPHHSSQNSSGSLVKNAAEFAGTELYSNYNKPVEQMGVFSELCNLHVPQQPMNRLC